jgi:hypothetical protein
MIDEVIGQSLIADSFIVVIAPSTQSSLDQSNHRSSFIVHP